MKNLQWTSIVAFFCVSCILNVHQGHAQTFSPVELTTDSILVVAYDATSRVLGIHAVNAPIRDVFDQIKSKTGMQLSCPEPLYGRITWSDRGHSPSSCLHSIAIVNGMRFTGDPTGTSGTITIAPEARTTFSLKPEERLRMSKTEIHPTPPTTGIMTGYLFFCGHYIPPPYQVTKIKTQPFTWEIRVNGLLCDRESSMPPPDYVPQLDANEQLGGSRMIRLYCNHLWNEAELQGKSFQEKRAGIEDFLRTQKYIKNFKWLGKYTLSINEGTVLSTQILATDHFSYHEQLSYSIEIIHAMAELVREIKPQRKLKKLSEAEPFILDELVKQEFVAGSKDLPIEERQQKVAAYYQKEVRKSLAGSWFSHGSRAPSEVIEQRTQESAERKAQRLAETLENHWPIFVQYPGVASAVPRGSLAIYDRLKARIAVAEAQVPIDVKICAYRKILGEPQVQEAWMLSANFNPTDELKQRLLLDVKRLKAIRDLHEEALRPPLR